MSYILDALKRSEAERERERGTAPSLHGQAHRVIDPAEDEVPVVPPLKAGRLVGFGMLLAGLLAGLAWWLWSPAPPSVANAPAAPTTPAAAAAVPPAVPPAAPPPPVTVAGAGAPQPPPLAPADPALPAAPSQPIPAPLPVGGAQGLDKPGAPVAVPAAPPPVPTAVLRDAPPPNPGAPATAQATVRLQPAPAGPLPDAVEPAPKAAAAPPPAPAPKTGPQRLSQLPPDLRRQLPPLKLSGSVYSPDVPARMLILDGQILREGQNAGPELLIEQIGPKAAVLSFRGQRFELPYGP